MCIPKLSKVGEDVAKDKGKEIEETSDSEASNFHDSDYTFSNDEFEEHVEEFTEEIEDEEEDHEQEKQQTVTEEDNRAMVKETEINYGHNGQDDPELANSEEF